jgi:hypothetical protein
MSVQVDFGITGPNFQAVGIDQGWDITWPGVIDDTHFVGVSFFDNSGGSRLVRLSESFSTDLAGTQSVREVVRGSNSDPTIAGVGFRFEVVVAPSH